MKIGLTASLQTDKIVEQIKEYGTDNSVGMFTATEAHRLMIPYTPMDTGMLYQNVVIEPFKITYNQPYAHRLFFGEQFHFSHEKHPNARSKWCEGVDKNQLARAVGNYIATRKGNQ